VEKPDLKLMVAPGSCSDRVLWHRIRHGPVRYGATRRRHFHTKPSAVNPAPCVRHRAAPHGTDGYLAKSVVKEPLIINRLLVNVCYGMLITNYLLTVLAALFSLRFC